MTILWSLQPDRQHSFCVGIFFPKPPALFLTEHYPDELMWEGHSACATVAHPAQEIKQNPGFPGSQVGDTVIRSFLVTHRYEPEM